MDYNATVANYSIVLDNIDEISRIECFENQIVLHLSDAVNTSSLFKEFQKQRSLIHGSREWGCTDEYNNEKPFYFQVNATKHNFKNGTMLLQGSHCSPFLLFQRLQWSLQITPQFSNANRFTGSNSDMVIIGDGGSWENTFYPGPVAWSCDLLQLAKQVPFSGSLDGSAVASSLFGFSPLTIYWDVDMESEDFVPYIYYTEFTAEFVANFTVDLALNFNSGSLSSQFEILPFFPVCPDCGVAFNVGDIDFDLGLLVGIQGEIDFDVSAAMSYNTGVTYSCHILYGFSYQDSEGFQNIYRAGTVSTQPYSESQLLNQVEADLTLHIIPTLEVGLTASYLSLDQDLAVQVAFSRVSFYKLISLVC